MDTNAAAHLALNDKEVFLKELRQATGASHKRLEEVPLSKAIISNTLTAAEYSQYLAKMNSFVLPFEQTCFPLLDPVFPDLGERKRSPLLEKDLAFLKSRSVEVPDYSLAHLPADVSLSYAAGCMYVMEGSVLGGKYIYKNVSSVLGYDAEHGAAYFNGYGAQTGRLWTAFLDHFTTFAVERGNKAEVLKGADDTFKKMFDILSR